MAMLIAWHVLNRSTYGDDRRFGKNFLVVAPGLTVKNRLQVLVPDSPGNYYDEFQIVPSSLFDKLRQGRVIVHNWHKLGWETEERVARRRSVDKRGAKSDEAYVREVLGELAASPDLMVINDEAHHAWRVPAESKVAGVKKEDIEEATKWIGGLDRIHAARGVRQCFDFSATPYAPSGKTTSEEALFGWIVSDFGLNDAIESGLVKTPRVVVRDDARRAADYKSPFYHLYNDPDVKDDLNRRAEEHEPLPDLVSNGYYFLGKDWLETAKAWSEAGFKTPPVMITVANRTETAARVKYAFDKGKIHIVELCRPDRTLHIDSKVLDKAESQDEPVTMASAAADDEEADEGVGRPLTKQQQAEHLRRLVDTVGQPGQPGEQIQNVISVGMLSEGWDAKTVTHIMGLRAFTSQLLCEQVIGRGLRRTSYEINKNNRFDAEYVNVFGVPFTFLPHEGDDSEPPPPPPPKTRVEALADREARYAIRWPNIVRIEHIYAPALSLDLKSVRRLELDASQVATRAELSNVIEGKPDLTTWTEIDLQKLAQRFRLQTIVFEVARDVFEQMRPSWKGNTDVLLAQLIRLVERFVRSDRLVISPDLFKQDELRRRIVLTLSMTRIVHHIWEAIRFENTERLEPIFDSQRPIMSTSDMRPWYTARPNELTRRSHINVCVYDSTWEASESFVLDRSGQELVDAWVKNDHLGFEILYVYRGVVRKYRPDFLIRLADGTMLVLEVKGQDDEEQRAKRRFLDEWVDAVNAHGGFGHWAADVSTQPREIDGILVRHTQLATT
jgi:type III restriction enzyme